MTPVNFIEKFKITFPEYKVMMEEEADDDLLYMQAGIIANILNEAIEVSDALSFVNIFNLIESSLTEADDELKNIIAVSILEHLEFNGRESILEKMPELSRKLYDDVNEYNKSTQQCFKNFLADNPDFKELWENS